MYLTVYPFIHLSNCLFVCRFVRLRRFRNLNKECTCHIVYRDICHFGRIAAANAVSHFSHYISAIYHLPLLTPLHPICEHITCVLVAVGAWPKLQTVSGAINTDKNNKKPALAKKKKT